MSFDRSLLRTIIKPRHRAATDDEIALFEATCERTGLDPLARQIYADFRSSNNVERMNIQATIDGFRVVAERSGDYLGGDAPQWCGSDGKWLDVWLSDTHPIAARVTVHKAAGGQVASTSVVAHWKEYAPTGGAMWTKMPALMLAKVAEALALRRAFPMVLSGIYTSEEMAQATPAEDAHALIGIAGQAKGTEYTDALIAERRAEAARELAEVITTEPEAIERLKEICKEGSLRWAAIKECYEKAKLTPPAKFADVFTGLDPVEAGLLETALRDRLISDTTDVPYPAAEVEPETPLTEAEAEALLASELGAVPVTAVKGAK